jgi:hypothetical protein
MQKFKAFLLAGLLAGLPFIGFAMPAQAVDIGSGLGDVGDEAGLSDAELPEVIGTLINVFLSILGIIFLVLVLYAGFLWMTAAGSPDKVTKAKTLLAQAIIGMILILASFAISNFVVDAIGDANL